MDNLTNTERIGTELPSMMARGEEIIQKVKEIRLKAQEDMRLVRDSHD